MKYSIGFLAGILFVISFTLASPSLIEPTSSSIKEEISFAVDQKQIDCMAQAIYFESRGEPLVGQLAVGLVVKNRSDSDLFPNDICDVVYQGPRDSRGNPLRNRCQFSWYCDGIPEKISDTSKWEQSIFVSKLIMYDKIFDFTDGSLYFHSTSVSPNWKLKKTGLIGNHIFYKKS